jgi:hypothetical protein
MQKSLRRSGKEGKKMSNEDYKNALQQNHGLQKAPGALLRKGSSKESLMDNSNERKRYTSVV